MSQRKANRCGTVQTIMGYRINVKTAPIDVVKRAALETHNQIAIRDVRGQCHMYNIDNIPRFVVTNYIRHNLTNYDNLVNKLKRKDLPRYYLSSTAIPLLKKRIEYAIRKSYGFSTNGRTEYEWCGVTGEECKQPYD